MLPATSHVTHMSLQQLANDNKLMIQPIPDGQSQVSLPNIFLVQEAISLGYTPPKERKDNFYFMSTLSGLEKSSMHH